MANTLPLNPDSWDLQLDAAGNLNLTTPDASIAQDVASAIRTFMGEAWYDASLGLPYFQAILGRRPPSSLLVAKIQQVAFSVAEVASVTVTALRLIDRQLSGTVLVTSTSNPQPATVTF
jgi:hypothetical protein